MDTVEPASARDRLERAARYGFALFRDAQEVTQRARARGARAPRLAAVGDPSLWALSLMRAAAAVRALTGSTLGLTKLLQLGFHIDVWSDDIGPGLRLPHPFGIVIGGGAHIGADCTLLHGVTIQHGEGTSIGRGSVLCAGAVVLAGARVGHGVVVGANSVVRGALPDGSVAVGAPARVARPARTGEAA